MLGLYSEHSMPKLSSILGGRACCRFTAQTFSTNAYSKATANISLANILQFRAMSVFSVEVRVKQKYLTKGPPRKQFQCNTVHAYLEVSSTEFKGLPSRDVSIKWQDVIQNCSGTARGIVAWAASRAGWEQAGDHLRVSR